jgi:hypothetical protein
LRICNLLTMSELSAQNTGKNNLERTGILKVCVTY